MGAYRQPRTIPPNSSLLSAHCFCRRWPQRRRKIARSGSERPKRPLFSSLLTSSSNKYGGNSRCSKATRTACERLVHTNFDATLDEFRVICLGRTHLPFFWYRRGKQSTTFHESSTRPRSVKSETRKSLPSEVARSFSSSDCIYETC
jgi:hypothetical protein